MNEHLLANQRWWDEAVPVHAASAFYDVEGFKAGKTSLLPVELAEVGEVRGKSLLHLQCHFGLDTLSWARQGASVTGIDFSAAAIDTAQKLAAETGIEARFLQTDLYDLPKVLDGEFDIVFTSYGVLVWLADIREWARIAASFLKPGGVFYIIEAHPLSDALAEDASADAFRLDGSYFEKPEPTRWEGEGDYADATAKFENKVTYEYSHSLGDIVSSLIDAGLQVEFLHEHPFCAWARLPSMSRGDDGYYRLPGDDARFPFMFSLRALKPA
jgi:SAM-dependent methyltransferase